MITPQELEQLKTYQGTNPMPEDFDAFWAARMEEAEAVPLDWELNPAAVPSYPTCDFLDLWFTGMGGARLYAKYLKPHSEQPVPLVLQFHGYPGAGRSWLEQASFAGMGCALIALDCPGQGGLGQDIGGYTGTTVTGHIVAGLDGDPKEMYYVRLHQNIRILARIVRKLEGIDLNRVYVNGASQGGGIGIACAALNPDLIRKAAILYPFLSDYQKVWELGADQIAYEGIRYYFRWFDPTGERKTETFTKLGYIDSHNFAHLVRCEVLFGTGLSDTICPPATQFAVYNNLTCKKQHHFYPEFEHEEIQAFDDLILDFFGEGGDGVSIPETVKTLESYSGSSFCPEDFTAFWKEQNQNAAQPRPVVWNRVPFHNPMADYWELSFPATDGELLTARFLRPKQGTPAPLVLMFHDNARRTRGWHHMTRFIALGYAVLALENREGCYSLTKGWEDGPAGLSLTQLYTDALTAAHLAGTLPGVDSTRMLAWGEGLGGGLAIVTAAMLPDRVVKCAALHPMPADFYKVWESGVREGLCAGLREQFRNDDPAHDKEEALFRALGYVDLCGFAPLLRGELLLGTGLMDTVALPAAQYAVYNRAGCSKRHLVYPNYLHERINFFENELVGFFRLAFD